MVIQLSPQIYCMNHFSKPLLPFKRTTQDISYLRPSNRCHESRWDDCVPVLICDCQSRESTTAIRVMFSQLHLQALLSSDPNGLACRCNVSFSVTLCTLDWQNFVSVLSCVFAFLSPNQLSQHLFIAHAPATDIHSLKSLGTRYRLGFWVGPMSDPTAPI